MLELLILGYAGLVVAAFAGAGAAPRWRWALLTLGTIAVLLPVAAIAVLLVYLNTHPIHLG
jgi:hypothetical protein